MSHLLGSFDGKARLAWDMVERLVMHQVVNEWAILIKLVEIEVSAPLLKPKKVATQAICKWGPGLNSRWWSNWGMGPSR